MWYPDGIKKQNFQLLHCQFYQRNVSLSRNIKYYYTNRNDNNIIRSLVAKIIISNRIMKSAFCSITLQLREYYTNVEIEVFKRTLSQNVIPSKLGIFTRYVSKKLIQEAKQNIYYPQGFTRYKIYYLKFLALPVHF